MPSGVTGGFGACPFFWPAGLLLCFAIPSFYAVATPLSQSPPLGDLSFEFAAVEEFAARRSILFGQLPEVFAKPGHAAIRLRTPVLLGWCL